MTPDELRKWAESQIQALISLGIDAIEAERSVTWLLDHLPPGADPRIPPDGVAPAGGSGQAYVFPAETLDEPLDEAAIADARTHWYQADAIPSKFKRLLDAREATN